MAFPKSPILVTGAAGFIGFHLTRRLIQEGHAVVGIDNLNPYYDVRLKEARLEQLMSLPSFQFARLDVSDAAAMRQLFADGQFSSIVHLAAQAGVRYSLTNPQAYIDSNITGLLNILEGCRHNPVEHLVFASSSSVYGSNTKLPFSVADNVDHPISLYAATKKSGELMAYTYAHLFGIRTTGLRFFTVYGPWGRPDMALFIFTRAILEGRPIDVFNYGKMKRDFTFVDDIVEGVVRVLRRPPETKKPPFQIYNIGNHQPVPLLEVIETLERALGRTAQKNFLPLQPGDVPETFADVDELVRETGFQPSTTIQEGLRQFVEWYMEFYARTHSPVVPPGVTAP